MNLILFQYPLILLLFILAILLLVLTSIARKHSVLSTILLAVMASLSVGGIVFYGFYYALPLWELFGLMMLVLLLCCILFLPKGGNS